MPTDPSGMSDEIAIDLNGEPHTDHDPADFAPDPDAKGPDPAQWDDPMQRGEEPYDPGHPDATRDDDRVHDETGAVVEANVVTHVKGPGPEWPQS